jgi:hypothetical protein
MAVAKEPGEDYRDLWLEDFDFVGYELVDRFYSSWLLWFQHQLIFF